MTTLDSNSFSYTPPPPPSPGHKMAVISAPVNSSSQHETQNASRPSKELDLRRGSSSQSRPGHITTTTTSATTTTAPGQQVRYCYFVSAASVATSRSRNPSVSRHTVYLTPHVQDDFAPNGPQPRSGRRSTGDMPRARGKAHVLGAHPPQIQLQFLEGEPLPPPQSAQSSEEALDSDTIDSCSQLQDDEGGVIKTGSGVQVARKDSGYSSSLSRQSSIMALGRGIRKVFWRTGSSSSKRSFEAPPSSQTTSLEYKIPQDMIDQDEWADDLARRLGEASSSSDMAMEWSVESVESTPGGAVVHATALAPSTATTVMTTGEIEAVGRLIQEQVNLYQVTIHAPPLVVTPVPAATTIVTETTIISDDTPDTPPALKPVVSYPIPPKVMANNTPTIQTIAPTLRAPPSQDCLNNKPQPPVPAPLPPSPSTKPTLQRSSHQHHPSRAHNSSSLSSLSGLVRRLTTAEFAWKNGKSMTAPIRPSVQHFFQESFSEVQLNDGNGVPSTARAGNDTFPRRKASSHFGNLLMKCDNRSVESLRESDGPFVQSPDEIRADSYSSAKPIKQGKRSLLPWNWTALKATDNKPEDIMVQQRASDDTVISEVRYMSEERYKEAQNAVVGGLRRSGTRRATISELEARVLKRASLILPSEQGEWILSPPEPLFMTHGPSVSSTSTLGDHSSCASVDNSTMDSADEWDLPGGLKGSPASYGFSRSHADSSRYSTDLKTLREMFLQDALQAGPAEQSLKKPLPLPAPSFAQQYNNDSDMSSNSSLVSLTSSNAVARSSSPSPVPSPAFVKDGAIVTPVSAARKDDYMARRKPASAALFKGHTDKGKKNRNKKIARSSYGGGELEIVKQAKFDTPEAIAKNLEIRRFIAKEIYTTEVNYLQYLRTVDEVFVKPLWNSFETSTPILPPNNGLCQLLALIPVLLAVSSRITELMAERVDDEKWSDTESLIGTVFLEVKEPLSVFLKYGQAYSKGMRALRSLLKTHSKRAAASAATANASVSTTQSSTMKTARRSLPPSPLAAGEWTEKRLSLPPTLQLTLVMTDDEGLESVFQQADNETVIPKSTPSKPRSIHGVLDSSASDEQQQQQQQRHEPTRRVGSTNSNISYISHASSSSSQSRTPSTTQQQQRAPSKSSSGDKQVAFSDSTETILSEWERFARNCAGVKEVTGRFSLADLLILPIQRVTRYCLLLKDLKKHTDVDHEDYVCLVHALEQVHTLAMATNDVQQPSSLRLK